MDWSVAIFGPRSHEPAIPADDGASKVTIDRNAPSETQTREPKSTGQQPPGGAAVESASSYARLVGTPCPDGWSAIEWRQVLDDVGSFLGRWSERAAELGWTAIELYGIHRSAPRTRYDVMGLVPLLAGRSLIALDKYAATIRGESGSVLTFRRQKRGDAVALESMTVFAYSNAWDSCRVR